jgi:hypothetical protein
MPLRHSLWQDQITIGTKDQEPRKNAATPARLPLRERNAKQLGSIRSALAWHPGSDWRKVDRWKITGDTEAYRGNSIEPKS